MYNSPDNVYSDDLTTPDVLTGQYAGLHVIEYILSIFFVFSTRNNSCVCILLLNG